MELKFLGNGSAFNVENYNTAAYYKNSKGQMLLIDCGESVFSQMIKTNALENTKDLYIAITHTHSDHIGSLGTTILYLYHNLNIKPKLILSGDKAYDKKLKAFLKIVGAYDFTELINTMQFNKEFTDFKTFKFIETKHVPNLKTFSIEFSNKDDEVTYYSGDTNDLFPIVKYLLSSKISRIYVDVTENSNDKPLQTHLTLFDLVKVSPKKHRHKIHCMHIGSKQLEHDILNEGFNLVKVEDHTNKKIIKPILSHEKML